MAFKFKLGQLVRVVNDMGKEPAPIIRIDSPTSGKFRGFVTWPIMEGKALLVVARLSAGMLVLTRDPSDVAHQSSVYVLMCGNEFYECTAGHLETMQ